MCTSCCTHVKKNYIERWGLLRQPLCCMIWRHQGNPPMKNKPRHEIISGICKKAGSTIVRVKVLTKDGRLRVLCFNPRDFNEIKGTGKSCTNPNIFRVREIWNREEGKPAWRTFDATRTLSIRARGEETEFEGVEQ